MFEQVSTWNQVSNKKGWYNILYKKKYKHGNLIVQIYVNDIIFGVVDEYQCKEFSNIMQNEFEMSMMDELRYFLILQIHKIKEFTFTIQAKYCK